MIADHAITRTLARMPLVAVTLYVVALGGLAALTAAALLDIRDQRRALTQASDLLAQLQGRHGRAPSSLSSPERPGSPFLEGPTVTVAGAALLQRVATAVSNVGGSVQSSQVDVAGTQARDGLVGLTLSCEMEQPALQKVLYDLEAGMPFLFVEQLDVQVPLTTATSEGAGGRIRVVLGVSGQWQGQP